MRGAKLVVGGALYAIGALIGLVLLVMVAREDRPYVRLEAPAAPALELSPGGYEVRPGAIGSAPDVHVFNLASREPLPTSLVEGVARFDVPSEGIYVVELPEGAGLTSVHGRNRFMVSPTLILTLVLAPLATLPGLAVLEGVAPARPREVVLGRVLFEIAPVRRRLLGVALDLVVMAGILVLLVLAAPLFAPVAPFFPFAPLVYLWAGNARGRSFGRWLTGTRVVTEEGEAPGPWRGLLRTAAWIVSWCALGGGYLVALLNPSRTAAHDALAGTRVVGD